MKGQLKKLKQQLKVYKNNCKQAKDDKKRLKKQINKLSQKLEKLKHDLDKAKSSKKKNCKAYKAGKEKLRQLKNNSQGTLAEAPKVSKPKPSPVVEAKVAPKPRRTTRKPTTTRKRRTTTTKDNLKLIEGIGPKIEQLLHKKNIKTFAALGRAPIRTLRSILEAAGPRFRMHKPDTWARQAKVAATGNMDRLKKLQEDLKNKK